jgi:hypothetical protein
MSENSGWANVTCGEVEAAQNAGFEPLPEGTFIFQLVPGGAKYRTKDFNGVSLTDINASAAIAEGDLKGRRVFFAYPDPKGTNKEGKPKTWSKQVFKKLSVVLGEDLQEGEDPVEYLNRVASSGTGRFTAKLQKGTYIPTGATEPRVELNLFSVAPAA